MSIILQVKRAAKDKGLYNGETDSLNWEPSHVIMYDRFCNRFGGHFSAIPSRLYQNTDFLEFVDKYSDPEYTEGPTEQPKAIEGAVLRDFVPEPRQVDTEGLSREDARKRFEAVNQNAIKMPTKPPAEVLKVEPTPDPVKVVETESEKASTDSASGANTDKKDDAGEAGIKEQNTSQADTPPEQTKPATGTEAPATITSNDSTVNKANTGETTPPVARQAQPNNRSGAPAHRNNGGTVKVR